METQLLKEAYEMLKKYGEWLTLRVDDRPTRVTREDLMERINDYLLRK